MATRSQVAAVSADAGNFLNDYLTEVQLAVVLKKDVRTLRRWDAERTGPPRTHAGKTSPLNQLTLQSTLRAKPPHTILSEP
jgi:hypothetical protein